MHSDRLTILETMYIGVDGASYPRSYNVEVQFSQNMPTLHQQKTTAETLSGDTFTLQICQWHLLRYRPDLFQTA